MNNSHNSISDYFPVCWLHRDLKSGLISYSGQSWDLARTNTVWAHTRTEPDPINVWWERDGKLWAQMLLLFSVTSNYWSRTSPCLGVYLAKPWRNTVGCFKFSQSYPQDFGWLLTEEACSDPPSLFPGSDVVHWMRSLWKNLCGLGSFFSIMVVPLFLAYFCSE